MGKWIQREESRRALDDYSKGCVSELHQGQAATRRYDASG